jgi:rhamnogalacturonyl hydrolase YesR
VVLFAILATASLPVAAGEETQPKCDYLKIVRDYADAMIAHGRDVYGQEHSPLFAEALDRHSMGMLEGEVLQKVASIPRTQWGIRPHDRMIAGGNPQHCLSLYQVLYALAEVTGEKRYADEADRSLKFCFEHCQSPATGLLWWGEHAGWDFRTEKRIDTPAGNVHEFYRPWVLWGRSWKVAAEPCRRFARGLWEHQIGDHQAGDFSRHAAIDSHGPGTEAPYARHGGFYIETWATAYEKTGEKVFLQAIESVLNGLERARVHEGGMLTGGTKRSGGRRAYDLSLAVSLGNAAPKVPPELAAKMREVASTNDTVFAKLHTDSGQREAATTAGGPNLWSNAYGGSGPAGMADTCMLRYRQVQQDVYRRVVLQTADQYRSREINLSEPVWPGTMGNVILLMLNAHELTGDRKYLDAADHFAQKGADLFLGDGSPLPKASHLHDHYEAVTNGDTLMMALLRLWQVQNEPALKLNLVFTDR